MENSTRSDSANAGRCVLNNQQFGCVGNTIKVFAGHYVDLRNPDPATIEIKSIARALSRICRFGGHCSEFYSVAEHSFKATYLALCDECDIAIQRAVLLHDATEAYLGDMVKPLKIMLPAYSEIESNFERVIGERFGVDFEAHREAVTYYDMIMLKAEKKHFFGRDEVEWYGFKNTPERYVDFYCYECSKAEKMFREWAISLGVPL